MDLGGSAVMMGEDGADWRPEDGWCSGYNRTRKSKRQTFLSFGEGLGRPRLNG